MTNRMLIESMETEVLEFDMRELNSAYLNTMHCEEMNPIETSLNKWYSDMNFSGERYETTQVTKNTRRSY